MEASTPKPKTYTITMSSFLKELPAKAEDLKESMVFLRRESREKLTAVSKSVAEPIVDDPMYTSQRSSIWASYRFVNQTMSHQDEKLSIDAIEAVEKHHGCPFVWATEFGNVHVVFPFDEPILTIDGKEYSSVEMYFQSMKSFGLDSHDQSVSEMQGASPLECWSIGNKYGMRADWNEARPSIMKKALQAKFGANAENRSAQHLFLHDLLLSTAPHKIVQFKPTDAIWGSGPDGKGQNLLGQMIMEVRDELLAQQKQ